jgi:formamidopyrimidine-DNA glycosylase
MPEYPDLEVYIDGLTARLQGAMLQRIEVLNPFLCRR